MPTLTWLTRDEDIQQAAKAPYRMLEQAPELSYGDPSNENMLIQGDNLDALKALLPYYAGQVKCIYIDPPYNTRSAFEQYDDNLEHTKWLSLLYPRIELLRSLLAEDGSIWVSIDDNEGHYLKLIMDEIFGRNNFVTTVIWQKIYTVKNSAKHFSAMHDYILVYAKNSENWNRNLLPRTSKQDDAYSNPDNDPRGPWKATPIQARNYYSQGLYSMKSPSGRVIPGPPKGTYWRISEENFKKLDSNGEIWWGEAGNNIPAQKRFLTEVKQGVVPSTIWTYSEAGHNAEAKGEIRELTPEAEDIFITPKPERLIQRILQLSTDKGDMVLDSFLGSGTTAAVAHKMGRRYIGIEIGAHAETHCQKRLQKVVDGEQGGISQSEAWQGGGGFRFYRLGKAVFDERGYIQPVIKFPTLAAHIWFTETNQPYLGKADSPLLGIHEHSAIGLLYNGILGDRRVNGGNVLTHKLLADIRAQAPRFDGPLIIYGECSRISLDRLREEKIIFKQTPYDIKVR